MVRSNQKFSQKVILPKLGVGAIPIVVSPMNAKKVAMKFLYVIICIFYLPSHFVQRIMCGIVHFLPSKLKFYTELKIKLKIVKIILKLVCKKWLPLWGHNVLMTLWRLPYFANVSEQTMGVFWRVFDWETLSACLLKYQY